MPVPGDLGYLEVNRYERITSWLPTIRDREEEVSLERHPVDLNAKKVSAAPMQLPMGERSVLSG
jgi:hypothetical protein